MNREHNILKITKSPTVFQLESEKCTIKFRNMTQQKTAWFVQYKDNGEIIVVKRIICCLNPFTTTTKSKIEIRKILTFPSIDFKSRLFVLILNWYPLRSMNWETKCSSPGTSLFWCMRILSPAKEIYGCSIFKHLCIGCQFYYI
jgi:hypothetical protein